jgi:hypothetical protein
MIFYTHIWVGYSSSRAGSSCKRQEGDYTLFITVSSVTIEAIAPIMIMTIFSLLTINNLHGLHQRRNRILPNRHANNPINIGRSTALNNVTGEVKQTLTFNQQMLRENKKVGKQLTMISFIQVLVYIMFNTVSASYSLYAIITSSITRSADRAAIESFINASGVLLTFVYGTVS